MEDGAASRATAYKGPGGWEGGEGDFCPGVLVAAEDDGGGVSVEEEDCGFWGGGGEEVVFEGEV